MEASGLRPEPGVYVDEAPVEILEQNNALSMFGLQRRLAGRGASATSPPSRPRARCRRGGWRRGWNGSASPPRWSAYYTEHVEADAVHEQVALRDVCVALVAEEPGLEPDVWFGAWACLDLENRTAHRLLSTWGVAA